MDGREAAIALIKADLATGKSTKRSLGIMYAHVMTGTRPHETDTYREVNMAILDAHEKSRKYLDDVKQVAWKLYEAARDAHNKGKGTAPAEEMK